MQNLASCKFLNMHLSRVSKLLASLGLTGRRRVVLGHTLNILRHVIIQTNLIMFLVNLRFCVGPHSQPSWTACSPRATGWTPLWVLRPLVPQLMRAFPNGCCPMQPWSGDEFCFFSITPFPQSGQVPLSDQRSFTSVYWPVRCPG